MRMLTIFLLILLAALQYKMWFAGGSSRATHHLEADIKTQQVVNQAMKDRNKVLEAEIKDLKQGMDAIEERARNELGMVKRNEVFYQVVE